MSWLEDALLLLLGDTRPVVLDQVDDRRAGAGQADARPGGAVAAGILDNGLENALGEVAVEPEP